MPKSLLLPRADVLKLDSGKMYFIHNNTTKPLTLPDNRTPLLKYARIPYPVESGQQEIVPFPVISLYFGDPRSRNGMIQKYKDSTGEGTIQSREAELARIAVFWGVYEQGVDTLAAVIPDITITTLQGQEIIPPCFDPYGEYSYGFEQDTDHTQKGAAAQLSAMQDQMDQLRAMMESLQENGDNDDEAEEDLPVHPALSGVMATPTP